MGGRRAGPRDPPPTRTYDRGSWGPKEADVLIAADGCWHNPKPEEVSG